MSPLPAVFYPAFDSETPLVAVLIYRRVMEDILPLISTPTLGEQKQVEIILFRASFPGEK